MVDRVLEILNIIVEMYGALGIGIMLIIVLAFTIQLIYYLANYAKISTYRDSQRAECRSTLPTVSVIIPMFCDDYPFLDERLPLIMAQEGVDFEVVIVYIGENKDFFEDLQRLQDMLPNITVTKIQSNPRFPISQKAALNVGIKAAQNECMIFTNTDCYPTCDRWLSLMASGFKRGDIVLGYTALEHEAGLGRYLMRATRVMESMNWLSRAVKGKPYRGLRSNIGWTKSLYYGARGFSHLNMNIGEDDLFIQRLLNNNPDVSIILSPRATLMEICWGGVKWWTKQFKYFRSSFPLYPSSAKRFERWELRSRGTLFISVLLSIILLPLELKAAAAILLAIRTIIVMWSIKRVSMRLGERGMVGKYLLFDTLSPIYMAAIDISIKLHRDPRVWR